MSGNGSAPEQTRMRLGGMALRNGLLIHGPTTWAAAARRPDGEIEVASGPKPNFTGERLGEVPMARGPLRLAEAAAVLPLARWRLRAARLPIEERSTLVAVIAAALATRGLRRLLPAGFALEASAATLAALPAFASLRDSGLASYHGVEHKVIGAYEQGAEDPADIPKEHQRCGSNLIVPLLVLQAAAEALLRRISPQPGPVARMASSAVGLGAAVELFVYAEKRPQLAIGRAVHRAGHEIQARFSTREPDAEQLEVGKAALAELLKAESAADSD